MTLRAKVDLRYASKDLKAGDEFEPMSEADALVLTSVGKAEEVAPSSKPPRRYNRRDMRPQN